MRITLMFWMMIGTASAAPTPALDLAELGTWSESTAKSLLSDCGQETPKKWLARYAQAEEKVIDRVTRLSGENRKTLPESASFRDLIEIVFPQDLPRNYPMRGAFASCFGYFEEYRKASHPEKVKAIEECYRERYRMNPPEILRRYLSCLKAIK